jgi:Protein of unknown function (DUF4446)
MNDPLLALASPLGLVAFAALLAAGVALVWLVRLQQRVRVVTPDTRRLVRDMDGKSIDEVVRDLLGNMEFCAGRIGRLEVISDDLAKQLKRTIQRVGLTRYNADEGIGGELSFALALLDEDSHGLMLTSVHTLHDCRLYMRTVVRGRCEHEMSEEEAEALEMALGRPRQAPQPPSRLRRTRWREKERASAGLAPHARSGDSEKSSPSPDGRKGPGNAEQHPV